MALRLFIFAAALNENPAVVQALLDAGANTEAKIQGSYTPLHLAVTKENQAVVQALLDSGANTEAKGENDTRPLHLAVETENLAVIQALLDSGASTEARDKDGWDPSAYRGKKRKLGGGTSPARRGRRH